MKRILFLFVLFFMAGKVFLRAQITVDSIDFATVGDTIMIANDTAISPSITPGGTGAQTWDFTSLQADYVDTLIFVNPAATIYASDFPSSNLAVDMSVRIFYQSKSASIWTNDGFAGLDPFGIGIQLVAPLDNVETLLEFPATLNSSFTDTMSANIDEPAPAQLKSYDPNIDSIGIRRFGYSKSSIDAYGTINTPAGTYICIRQLLIETTNDTIYTHCKNALGCLFGQIKFGWNPVPNNLMQIYLQTDNPLVTNFYTYKWLANGQDYPVAELVTDTVGGNVLAARFKVGSKVLAMIASPSNVVCNGQCTGSATATAISGTSPYNFKWGNGSTTASVTGLCTGIYTVTVTDGLGDSSVASVTISEPVNALLATTTVLAQDSGNATGSITAAALGGTPAYAFSWSNGKTTQTITGLAAGVYSVTVTDANGCTFVATDTVTLLSAIKDSEKTDRHNGYFFPNPASETLYISSPWHSGHTLTLFNIIGKPIKQIQLKNSTVEVDISPFPPGMYLYLFSNNQGEAVSSGKFNVMKK